MSNAPVAPPPTAEPASEADPPLVPANSVDTLDVAPPRRESPRTRTRWYGWQTLATDAAAVVLVVAAVSVIAESEGDSSTGTALAYLSLGAYALGGPVVHIAHENYGRAAGSFGLRVGGPIVGGALGCAADGSSSGYGCLGGLALGMFLGTLTAVVVDSAALAYEKVPATAASARKRKPQSSVTPGVALTRKGGALVGLSGTF